MEVINFTKLQPYIGQIKPPDKLSIIVILT